jgi:PAS domain-containing protein
MAPEETADGRPTVPAHQHPVELIMARGFAANLATPAFLVDEQGALIFFNDAAAELLGVQFADAEDMLPEEWGGRFEPTTRDGRPLPLEELPLGVALYQSRAAHSPMRIRSSHGEHYDIEVTAFPVIGRTGPRGAIAIFWESRD